MHAVIKTNICSNDLLDSNLDLKERFLIKKRTLPTSIFKFKTDIGIVFQYKTNV